MTASEAEHIVGSRYDYNRDDFITRRHHSGEAPAKRAPVSSWGHECYRAFWTIIVCSLAWALIAHLAAIYGAWCKFSVACQ